MKQWQYQKVSVGDELIATQGKFSGQRGRAVGKRGGQVGMNFGTDPIVYVTYSKLEFIDAHGHPLVKPVTDMSGRELAVDNYIAYSSLVERNGFKNTHALEVGRIVEITDIGWLKVRAITKNGRKLEDDYWRRNLKSVTDPFRTLKLPADTPEVVMWIMKDFEGLRDEA